MHITQNTHFTQRSYAFFSFWWTIQSICYRKSVKFADARVLGVSTVLNRFFHDYSLFCLASTSLVSSQTTITCVFVKHVYIYIYVNCQYIYISHCESQEKCPSAIFDVLLRKRHFRFFFQIFCMFL